MSVRDAITVVGTAIGAYFGYPQLGYAIGSALGNAVDPQTIRGPSLGDISRQTSMEGVPRPIVWALSPPMAGNIIASSEPKIVRKRQRQGKGGPKVQTEHVYRTYAVGVCEGQITRFVRVWRNNTLVYDVSEFPLKTHQENVDFMRHARFFLGSFSQNASPALERVFGIGTTPSHRGTAYMVMDDEELTDLRGAIPQYQFQVERCEGFYLTSRPYPLNEITAIDIDFGFELGFSPVTIEGVGVGFGLISGDLNQILLSYDGGEIEALQTTAFSLISIFNSDIGFIEYESGDPEAIDVTGFSIISGELDVALIGYDDYPPEAVQTTSFSIISGTLS